MANRPQIPKPPGRPQIPARQTVLSATGSRRRWRWPNADASNAISTFFLVLVGAWGVLETRHSLQLSERAWLGGGGAVLVTTADGSDPANAALLSTL